MEIIKVNGNDIVRKSEFLVKARYKLNPLALKFITTIIANLKRSDEADKEYVFKVKDFAELLGVSYHDIYAEMEEAVEELLKKPLHIKTNAGWLKTNWISGAEYKEGEGAIAFYIFHKLRPYLLAVQEKFLQYRLENILKLRSSYSIRMYEILKDWYNTIDRYSGAKKVEKIVEIKWLREALEIPSSYRFNNIKERILEKAKRDLLEHTDTKFKYEEIKTGRKVTHIKFIIEENAKNANKSGKKDKYSFMKTLRSFINYLRANYVNKPLIITMDKETEQQVKLSISEKGLLYDMYMNVENYNAQRSYEIYKNLYEYAKSNEKYRELLANKEEFNI